MSTELEETPPLKNLPDIPRQALVKGGVVSIIGAGLIFCSWSGGFLGLWAMFVAAVIGTFSQQLKGK